MRVHAAVCFASNGRADHVTDSHNQSAFLLGLAQGRKGIGGFSRLGYHNNHIFGSDNRIAVPEFRSVINLDGNTGKLLDKILPDQSGMPACAAGADNDTPCLAKLFEIIVYASQMERAAFKPDPASHDILHNAGLFENLLEHKVFVTALFDLFKLEIKFGNQFFRLDVLDGLDHIAVSGYTRHFPVAEVNHLPGMFDDRSGIRSHEIFAVTDTDYQRTALAGDNQRSGFTG